MLKITPFSKNKKVERLHREWPERIKAIVKEMAFESSEDMLGNIRALAPKDIPMYPDILDIVDYGEVDEFSVFGIIPPNFTFTQLVVSMDVQRTALYIIPKVSRGVPVSDAAAFLAEYNPWTMMSLPWEPKSKEADIVSRKVSLKEIKYVEYERNKYINEIKSELKSLGVNKFRENTTSLKREKLIKDLAFEILRREFGVEGEIGIAHWRPAARKAATIDANKNFKKLWKWFGIPDNSEWRHTGRAKKSSGKIATVQRKIKRFQELVSPNI